MATTSAERPIRLVAGLGNPGARYAGTRHNVGFWLVEEIARRSAGQFRENRPFLGQTCRVEVEGAPVWLLKPGTFMNRSGASVRALAYYHRIPVESVLVVHDELDLEPGTVRLKRSGGHGGHNGLRDLHAQLGNDQYRRLRIGIGHPGVSSEVMSYVLSRPSPEDREQIEGAIDAAVSVLPAIVRGELERAMNVLHTRPRN